MALAVLIEKLQFRWQPMLPLVLDIDSLEIKMGESVFIRGPSGSGKTTLLNIIGGVLEPLDGRIEVLGHDFINLSHQKKDSVRGDQMGFIFQQFNLMPYLSVLENITLPIEFSKERLEKLKEMNVSAIDEARRLLGHLKFKVDDIIAKPVTQLSVGQQQRVAVARALMARPPLIIADEPTSALDADARESFIKILFEECKSVGSTLIFVSHDAQLGNHFDRQIDLTHINKAYSAVEV